MTPKPGIYEHIPFDEYLSWDAVNNTILEILINKSPAHAKEYRDNPPKETPALRVGHALHTRLLEPHRFNDRYAIRPECDRRTKVGKKIYELFISTLNGRTELTKSEFEIVDLMCKKVETKGFIHQYVEKGEAEICIVWEDQQTGLLCKARLDYLQRRMNCIVDLKTTIKTAGYDDFSATIFRFDYYQQAGWYCDGLKTLIGDMPFFVFMVLEKQPPYECRAWEASDDIIIAGRKAYRKALKIYAECVKKNEWPGYPDRVEVINMPQWALNKAEVGDYNLISEDEENDYSGGTIETDWEQLERKAHAEERNTKD